MELVRAQCPQCSAMLEADPSREFMFCPYCGMKYFVSDAIKRAVVDPVPGKASADKLFTDAEALVSFEDYQQALEKFGKLAAEFPTDPRGWFGMTRVMFLWRPETFGTNAPLRPLPEMMKRALTCGADRDECTSFFTDLLNSWEKTAEMKPFVVKPYGVGTYAYYRGEYGPCFEGKTQETVYEPSGDLWSLAVNTGGFTDGCGEAIKLLNDKDLNRRVDHWRGVFREFYLTGKAVGDGYQQMPELQAIADNRNRKIMSDPDLVCDLLKQAGKRLRYDRGEQKYYTIMGAYSEENGRFSFRRKKEDRSHDLPLVIKECTVIGRTLKLVDYDPWDCYNSTHYYLLPRVVEI